jgi:energy-converting hydrogenase A subunit B
MYFLVKIGKNRYIFVNKKTFIQYILKKEICWRHVMLTVIIIFKLPEKGGVSGAKAIGNVIEEDGGNLHGGFMMGNIVCSPDASAGTLLAACGVYIAGIPGGLSAAFLVFIGNRICHDPGYAGTSGAILATLVIYGLTGFGFVASDFIAGMVIAILTIQGLSHIHASRLLGTLWRWRS